MRLKIFPSHKTKYIQTIILFAFAKLGSSNSSGSITHISLSCACQAACECARAYDEWCAHIRSVNTELLTYLAALFAQPMPPLPSIISKKITGRGAELGLSEKSVN